MFRMLSKYQLNLAYSEWFKDRIKGYIHQTGCQRYFDGAYLSQNGFFMTLGFDRNRVAKRKASDTFQSDRSGSVEFYNFNHFYNLICKRLIGRKYAKSEFQSLLPLVIACADAQGTKYWRSMGQVENVHLHAIWVLRPEHGSRFETVVTDLRRSNQFNTFDFDEIDIRPIDRFEDTEGPTSRLTSYASKFLAFNSKEASFADDLRIYPRAFQ